MRTKPMTLAQRRVLHYLKMMGTFEGAYAELGSEHHTAIVGQFSILAIDRSLDACVRRGWARQKPEGDYEITDAGREGLGYRVTCGKCEYEWNTNERAATAACPKCGNDPLLGDGLGGTVIGVEDHVVHIDENDEEEVI